MGQWIFFWGGVQKLNNTLWRWKLIGEIKNSSRYYAYRKMVFVRYLGGGGTGRVKKQIKGTTAPEPRGYMCLSYLDPGTQLMLVLVHFSRPTTRRLMTYGGYWRCHSTIGDEVLYTTLWCWEDCETSSTLTASSRSSHVPVNRYRSTSVESLTMPVTWFSKTPSSTIG